MERTLKNQKGFTLVELLIVVIILGILAAVAIPQFGDSTQEAREETLNTNLATLRSAVELYMAHHGEYPGALSTDGLETATNDAQCKAAFIAQLTQYTDGRGYATNDRGDASLVGTVYGPYMKKSELPENPFVAGAALSKDVLCVTTSSVLTLTSSGTEGWKFNSQTGRAIANDGAHDAN